MKIGVFANRHGFMENKNGLSSLERERDLYHYY